MTVVRFLAAFAGLAAAVACASAPASRDDRSRAAVFPVGVSQIDITPEGPIRLTGYGNRVDPATVVRQRLWAKALAFGADGERPAVLLTADLVGVSREVVEDVARRLAKVGVEREQLAVATTHTHTGPSLAGVLPFIFSTPVTRDQRAAIERYTRQLVDKLEKVATAALKDRRPATLAWAVGKAGFAANRRVLKNGKWVGFGIEPAGVVDRDLPMLAVREPGGRLKAVLVSYACHATTLEGKDNFVHGDWPGAAQSLIQDRHRGAVAMVTIGTGADANPNPRGGGLTDVERHGREVADEVERLFAGELRSIRALPAGKFRYLDLAFRRVPTRAELEAQAAKADPSGFLARSLLDRLERGERVPQTTPYPVQTWTFGDDLAMVFLGGEVVADYGLRLERELDASRLWVNAYSNDVAFYVASRRMIPEGGYEVDRSMVYYGQPGPLAEQTEDRIIAAVRDLLPAVFVRR